jgi:hypothetical protein
VIPVDSTLLALATLGAALGYLLFQRWWGRPWGSAYRRAGERLSSRVARAAPLVARLAELPRAEVAAVQAFYTRWINLPRDEREAHRERLRSEGIDMIRLGDSLRWFRDRE